MSFNYALSVALCCTICGSITYVMRSQKNEIINYVNLISFAKKYVSYLDIVGVSMLIKEIVFRYLVMFNSKSHFMLLIMIGTYFTFISKKIVEKYHISIYNSVLYIYMLLYVIAKYLHVSFKSYTVSFAYGFLISYFSFFLLRVYSDYVLRKQRGRMRLIISKLTFVIASFALYTCVYIISMYYINVCISAFVITLTCHIVHALYRGYNAFLVPLNDVINMLKDIVFVSLFFSVNITADTVNIFTEGYSYMIYIMSSASAVINKFMMTALCIDVQHDHVQDNVSRAIFVTTVHAILCASVFMYYGIISTLPMSLILSASIGSLIYTYTKVYCLYTQHYAHMVHAYNAFLFVSFVSILAIVRFLLQVQIISSVNLYIVCWTWNVTYLLNLLITHAYVQYLQCMYEHKEINDVSIVDDIHNTDGDILLYTI